jgi:multiple sugar transport system substrate-binding protein
MRSLVVKTSYARRRARPLLSAVLLLCAVAALPASTQATTLHRATSPTVTLLFEHQWTGIQENYVKQIIPLFEKQHPNIIIKESLVGNTTKIIAAMSGGKPPDIVDFGLGQFVPELASKGALTDLSPYVKAAHLDMNLFVPASVQVVSFNGHVYGLPFMNFNHALLYNKALFRQAGISHPPTTLEELEADAYRLTKVDKSGKILQMGFIPDWPGGANGQAVNLVDYGWLFGGGWYDAKTQQLTVDNPANIKALEWETRFYKKYGATNIDNFVKSAGVYNSNDVFDSGKLAMCFDGEWMLDIAPKSLLPVMGAAPFPAPRGLSRYTGTSYIDTNPQVIPSGSAHKQEAFEFIKWEATNAYVTKYFAQRVFNLPQLLSVSAQSISSDPRFGVFVADAAGPNAHVFPRVSFAAEMDTKLQNAEAAVLHGQQSAASALQALQTDLQNSSAGQ